MQEVIAFTIVALAAGWLIWNYLIPAKLKPGKSKGNCGPDCKCGD